MDPLTAWVLIACLAVTSFVPCGAFILFLHRIYEREQHPPQDTIYMIGARAVGSNQKILVTEGYA